MIVAHVVINKYCSCCEVTADGCRDTSFLSRCVSCSWILCLLLLIASLYYTVSIYKSTDCSAIRGRAPALGFVLVWKPL